MAKNIANVIKIQVEAGKAKPAPPVGTVLGPAGINLQEFCTKYNDMTRDKMGDVLPVEITVYEDRTFDFVIKTPPTAFLIKKYAKVQKGSVKGKNEIVGSVTEIYLRIPLHGNDLAVCALEGEPLGSVADSSSVRTVGQHIERTVTKLLRAVDGLEDLVLWHIHQSAKRDDLGIFGIIKSRTGAQGHGCYCYYQYSFHCIIFLSEWHEVIQVELSLSRNARLLLPRRKVSFSPHRWHLHRR